MTRPTRDARELAELRAAAVPLVAAVKRHMETRRTPVRCLGAGCSGCCRGHVAALPAEVSEIAARMTPEAWERLGLRISVAEVCPLLDPESGRCSVYDVRPIVCRNYFAISAPSRCHVENGRSAVALVVSPELDVLLERAFRRKGTGSDAHEATLVRQLKALDTEPPRPPVDPGPLSLGVLGLLRP